MCSDPEYVYKGVRLWGCSFEDLDSGHHDGMAVRLMFHALCDEIQAEGGTKRGGDETSYHLAFGYAVGLREDTSRPDGGIFVPDDEPDPQVTVDQNLLRDYFRELCILAHEGGHLRSYKREEAPPGLAAFDVGVGFDRDPARRVRRGMARVGVCGRPASAAGSRRVGEVHE